MNTDEHPCAADWRALSDRFSIFPLKPGQKTPTESWTPYQTRKPNEEELTSWLTDGQFYNVAVATGAVSGIVVLDLDSPQAETFAIAQGLPATPEVKTPRGRHLYFRHPGVAMSNSAGKIANQIDFRGDGGYVVGPGSYYVPTPKQASEGKVEGSYEWVAGRTPADIAFANLPAWAIPTPPTPVRPIPTPISAPTAPASNRQEAYAVAALTMECDALRCAPQGQRNHQLNKSAFAVAQLTAGGLLDEMAARHDLEQAALLAGLSLSEIRKTLASAWKAGTASPRALPDDDAPAPLLVKQPTREPLVFRSAADACRTSPKEREWLIDGWLPVGATTLLTGDGGMGKSLVAMQMAAAIASGHPLWGCATAKSPVLALYCEDDGDELDRRQLAINASMGLKAADLTACQWQSRFGQNSLIGHIDKTGAFITNDLFAQLRDAALTTGARLVILDNINMVFGDNINDPGVVTRFMAALNGLALEINGAVLLLGHIAKGEGSRFAGTAAWSNASRNRLFFGRPEGGTAAKNPDMRVLSRDKANYARTGETLELLWEHGAFIAAADVSQGRTLEDCADDKRFLTHLDRLTGEQVALSISRQAKNFAPRVMAEVRSGFANGNERKAMERAMGRLLTDGTLLPDVPLGWKKSNRHEATGIKRADSDPATMVKSSTMEILEHLKAPSSDPIMLPSQEAPQSTITQAAPSAAVPLCNERSAGVAYMLDKLKARGRC